MTTFTLNGNTHTIKATDKLEGVTEIYIEGLKWFQESYGNTYHRAYISILKDGKWQTVGHTEIQYGYGDQYLTSAGEWLIENGYIDSDQKSGYYLDRLNMEKLGIVLSYRSEDVKRKKDM